MTDISTFNESMTVSNGLDVDEVQYADTTSLLGRLQFPALLIYLTCHAYTIPVLTIGPWGIWPKLDDFTFLLLVFIWMAGPRTAMDEAEKRFLKLMVWVIVTSLISIILVTAILFRTTQRGINFGIFQTARLLEYLMVWVSARNIIFDDRRITWVRRTLTAVVLFIVVIGFLNALQIVTPSALVRHLPAGFDISGPWHYMKLTTRAIALGPLGYNPAYMAAQLSFLTVILLGIRKRFHFLISATLAATSFVVVFLSGSRAGLVIFVAAILIWSMTRLRRIGIFIVSVALLIPVVYFFRGILEEMLPRQAEIFAPGTAAGRTEIWSMDLKLILDNPVILLTGTGWGNTMVYTQHAGHDLYLHILLESGVLGLAIFSALVFQIFKLTAGAEEPCTAFRAAFIGILVGATTQETLFPVVAMGSFLGLFLCILGIVSSIRRQSEQEYATDEPYNSQEQL